LVDPNTRQSKRTPVTLKIKFKSETLAQFIERYAVDVSQGGIFIRTKEPLPAGTPMRFEFQLKDASPLIAGEGTVVWTRENDPTRPGVAPGMGVRFDRLADGSQEVLDRILAEKAKQTPAGRHHADTKPPMNAFQEVPTRVAPSPLVNALAGESGKAQSRSQSFGDNRADTTPLPNPMPFHSDAEDFPDEAFEEATKVRALDELVAQSAAAEAEEQPPEIASALDELAQRRAARTSQVPAPSGTPTLIGTAPALATREGAARADGRTQSPSAPAPNVPGASPRLLDTSPSPRTAAPRISEKMPVAAIAEPLPPPPVPRGGSRVPMIIVLVLIAAAAGAAAVWFLVLKEKDEDITVRPGAGSQVAITPGSGSATPGSGGATALTPGSGAGSAVEVGSGSAMVPAADWTTVTINTNAEAAVVEVVGSDQTGDAPFAAKIENGKTATIRVTAPGFAAKEVQVTGGDKPVTVALIAMGRTIHVTSTPSGAQIFVENGPTGKLTPADIKLSSSQAARSKVRVTLRKAGYTKAEQFIAATAFAAGADGGMVADFDATLVVMRSSGHTTNNNNTNTNNNTGAGSGSADAGTGSGSATGTGTGSATTGSGSGSATPTGTGSGSAVKPGSGSGSATSGTGAGSAAKPGSGSAAGAGSAKGSGAGEPTPDWMK